MSRLLALIVVVLAAIIPAYVVQGRAAPLTRSVSRVQLSARWLLLAQVAIHIRGRLTTDGHPLAGQPITLSADSGRRQPRVIGRVRSAADGSFGLHFRVVRVADWRRPATRRSLQRTFRYVAASFAGDTELTAARARVAVAAP